MYSQKNEEEIILNYFKERKDRFLDIGAYNGKDLSNTHQLALNGWGGICIEPSPIPFKDLLNLYHNRKDITLINTALDTRHKIIKFFDSNGDAISTTEPEHVDKWKVCDYREFFIQTMSIDNFVAAFGTDFQFISIDTESSNLRLFEQVLEYFVNGDTEMICVEHDGHQKEMTAMARRKGFNTTLLENVENLIFVR